MNDKTRQLEAVFSSLPEDVKLIWAHTKGVDPELMKTADEIVVGIHFSDPGYGFGEITIMQTKEGVFIDTELMSIERVKGYVCALIDRAISDNEMHPAKHALYNRVMGRSCGHACKVCHPQKENQ